MSELKPCPFCGESKLLYSGGCGFRYDDDDNQIRLFRVHCRTCKGRTGLFESLDEAVEAWNRRTNSTTIQPSALGTNLAPLGTDCISRQSTIDALRGYLVGKRCPDDGTLTCRLIENEVINKLPTAQPEIVRCKDCKYLEMTKLHHCTAFNLDGMEAEFFCGFAKRREVTT